MIKDCADIVVWGSEVRKQLRDWFLILLMFQIFLVFSIANSRMIVDTFGIDT